MKNKITSLIALAAVFSASATSPAGYPAAKADPAVPDTAGTRWHINGDYSIRWDIGNDIPHYDHLEMSGEQVSVVYYYGVDGDGSFSMERSVVWPMLRTIPNDTHASLTVRFNTDFLSGVTVDGQKLEGEKVSLLKKEGDWKISWESMLGLSADTLDQTENRGEGGMDYTGYLTLFLMLMSNETLMRRMTHLMEKNIRLTEGNGSFCMSNCIYGIRGSFDYSVGGIFRQNTAVSMTY